MIRIAVVATLLGGCVGFDDLRGEAWSDSRGLPDGMASSDYGIAVTTVDHATPGATIVVAGAEPGGLATLSYDDHGELTQRGVVVADGFAPTPELVGALDRVPGGDGVFAVGSNDEIALYDARTGMAGPTLRATIGADACGAPIELFGAIVIGTTSLGTVDVPDLIVIAGTELIAFPDVGFEPEPTCVRCTLPGRGMDIAVADVDAEVDEELVVSIEDPAGGAATLGVLEGTEIAGGDCFTTPPDLRGDGAEPDFGRRLAVGDADDNGAPEVAVVAPSTGRVYVAADLSFSGAAGSLHVIVTPSASSDDFPGEVTFGDLDGDGLEELAVADPSASPGGAAGAGWVTIFRLDDGTFETVTALHDSAPEPGQAFGRALAIAEFLSGGDATDLLVVAANDEVFTYFRALVAGGDPRL